MQILETELVRRAYAVASAAHRGQLDKGGHPYIGHPLAVARLLSTEAAQTTALLHDVIEDTSLTLQDLLDAGFPGEVVEAVDCLTQREGEPRQDYLRRVKQNPLARAVKLADLTHNSDLRRIPHPTQRDLDRAARYRAEQAYLTGA